MKKFLISLFIVVIFAVVVFFIGLAPLRVQPDSFGVLISKTSGIDEKPIMNGEMAWYWELLLPTNVVIKEFSPKPLNVTKTITGELPSGALYAQLFNASDNFQYRFSFNMSLTVTPENVIELLKQNKISNNDDLQAYLSAAADSVAQLATDYYLKKVYKDPDFRPESVRREQITKNLSLYEDFPEVELSVFALTDSKYPDYNLYKKLQNQGSIESFGDAETAAEETSSAEAATEENSPVVQESL